jgi:RHS repeat-associated protein
VIGITNALGQTTTLSHTAQGLPTQSTDPLGRQTQQTLDALGRVTRSTNALGQSSTIRYDALDRPTMLTDALGQSTTLQYDPAGRLSKLTDASGAATQYQYDSYGRRTAQIHPDGTKTSYAYRADNLLSTITWPDGATISYQYDANKRLSSETAGSESTNYSYNSAGQVIRISGPGGTVEYSYDAAGRMGSETSGGITHSSKRNPEGERVELASSTGGASPSSQSFERDSRGLISKIISNTKGSVTFNHDALGRLTQLTYPSGASAASSFDAAGQRTSLAHSGDYASTNAYTYDVAGRITQITSSTSPASPATQYSYDALGRLSSSTSPANSYRFDRVGNLQGQGRQYDVNHRLSQDEAKRYSYDPRGNLSKEQDKLTGAQTVYSWNVKNQLIKVEIYTSATPTNPSRTLQYSYDPLGRRASKTDNTNTERYSYDGQDRVATLNAAGQPISSTLFSQHGIDEPLLSQQTGGASTQLYANHQGSIVATSTAGQATQTTAYGPYGETASAGQPLGTTPFGYTARERDTESLYYYRARYYSTAQQRFISQDPIGLAGGINTYAYVGGDPISGIDPYGLFDITNPADWPQLPPGAAKCIESRRWDWGNMGPQGDGPPTLAGDLGTAGNLANSAGNFAAGATGSGVGSASHATSWQHRAGSVIGQVAQQVQNGRRFGSVQAVVSRYGKVAGRLAILPTMWEGYWDIGSIAYCTCSGQ